MLDFIPNVVQEWLMSHGVRILLILLFSFVIRRISKTVIDRAVRKIVVPDNHVDEDAEKKREDTIIRVFSGAFGIVLWIVVFMMVLSEIGLDVGPLIAGAGIVGVALGFGGQYLVRDVISGLFMILENQYRVGDVVSLNDIDGKVEDITLRTTTVRDKDGVVYYIQNGEIKKSANKSNGFAVVNVDVGVSYDADLKKVSKVVNDIGKEMAGVRIWKSKIKKAPKFLRVQDLADSAVLIRVQCETKPGDQFEVRGELLKRLKLGFDKSGIEIPYPQMVVRNK